MNFNKKYYEEYKDQFNYYNLIKNINPGFRLYFNKINKKFTIINIYNNFEICKEFNTFFGNILQDLRFYKIENLNYILKFTEKNNNKIEQKTNDLFYEKSKYSLSELIKINNRSNKINKSDINKIIGATKC